MAEAMQAQNPIVKVGVVGGELINKKLIEYVTLIIRMTIIILFEGKGKAIFLGWG